MIEHEFIYLFYFDIISYFKSKKYNISRILFPYSKKKNSNLKNINEDEFGMDKIKESKQFTENKLEDSDSI